MYLLLENLFALYPDKFILQQLGVSYTACSMLQGCTGLNKRRMGFKQKYRELGLAIVGTCWTNGNAYLISYITRTTKMIFLLSLEFFHMHEPTIVKPSS